MAGPKFRFRDVAGATWTANVIKLSDDSQEETGITVTAMTNAVQVYVSAAMTAAPSETGLFAVELMQSGVVNRTRFVWLDTTDDNTVLLDLEESPSDAYSRRNSSGGGATAEEVWTYTDRVLTAGDNIVLAKGVGVTGLNDLDVAALRSGVGLAAANLDAQLAAIPTTAPDNASIAAILADTAELQANQGNWLTATGFAVPGDQMDFVAAPNTTALTAIGAKLEAMILDEGDATALLAAIAAKVEEFLVNEGDATATIAAIAAACNAAVAAGTVGTNVSAIKAKTDNLPASPAAAADCQTGAAAALVAYDTPSRSDVTNAPTRGEAFVLQFPMTLSRALKTGLSVSGMRRHPGDVSFSPLTNSVAEAGYGFYEVTLTAAEMDAGNVAVVFSATGADSRSLLLVTQ